MTSPGRIAGGAGIYTGLAVGAVITLAPFVLGLLTSFTSAQQFTTGSPLSLPTRRRWRTTRISPAPGSAGPRW